MKTLLIGLGQVGLGLIVPVFQKAGYEIVGTDANVERLNQLRNGYALKTPSTICKFKINVRNMDETACEFDLVITSVGRQHLDKVSAWCKDKNISAPILLAENLPDPVHLFPRQIPIVVDRICPRVEIQNGTLTVIAEDYYKIVALDDLLTRKLSFIKGVELKKTAKAVETKRKQKMFTVNTSHFVAALYGLQKGYMFVEEAISDPEIASTVEAVLLEIGAWLGFSNKETIIRSQEIIKRFSSPMKDPLSRILNPDKKLSAMRYVEVPLNETKSSGKGAPALEEVFNLLAA